MISIQYIMNQQNQPQNITVDQLMCKTIKQLREIAKTHNITGVFTYNKNQLAEEIAKRYGYKPRTAYDIKQDYQIHDDVISIPPTNYQKRIERIFLIDYETSIFQYMTVDDVIDNEYPKLKYILNNVNNHINFD